MDKLLYISTSVPKEEVERLQQKQHNFASNALLPISVFHGNILSGLCQVYDEVCALSGVPIDRKNYKILRYRSQKTQSGKVRYIIPGFFNVPVVKQLTVMAKLCLHIIRWCRKNKEHNCNIVIDGTFYSGLISLWLASGLIKAKTCAIIVDHYSFMDPSRQRLSQKLYYHFIKGIGHFVFVTEHLQKLVNGAGKKYMIMEGLVSPEQPRREDTVGGYCLYAGGLHEIYGVKNLVDAFHESDIHHHLHLYGNGDLVEYIQQIAREDERIEYKGVVPHDRLLEIERGAKLLINPRPVNGKLDTRYNFPSKLMEYMQSGRPVITTRLLGIPEEYDGYMYFFEDDTKQKLGQGIRQVLSEDEACLGAFGSRARKYVNENKNSRVIAKKIFRLMNGEEVGNEENNG